MSISNITMNRSHLFAKEGLVLKNGQIVQGTILKLFPNNTAKIRIGREHFIAKITTPLESRNSYLFQVEQAEEQLIQLKVIGENHIKENHFNVIELARFLGISFSKSGEDLLNMLLNDKIPFTPKQIKEAITILEKMGNNPEAKNVIKQMILSGLPINQSIFQALLINKEQSLTNTIHTLYEDLLGSPTITETEKMLQNRLNQLLVNGSKSNLFSKMSDLYKNIQFLQKESEAIIRHFQKETFTLDQFSTLKNNVREKLYPLLTENVRQTFEYLFQLPVHENQKDLYHLLTLLTNKEPQEGKASHHKANDYVSNKLLALHFLSNLYLFKNSIGLQDEFLLKVNHQKQLAENQLHSIKSLLIKMVQEGTSITQEKIQPFLLLINGMQLQSVQESNHLLQAILQMPGQPFSLQEDLYLHFEGRKTSDGEIDPEFCRILFILHLNVLKETIIDMNIQKRVITITIYNDYEKVSHPNIKSLEKLMATNLEHLDFTLSSIKWRPLQEKETRLTTQLEGEMLQKEGFDFRI